MRTLFFFLLLFNSVFVLAQNGSLPHGWKAEKISSKIMGEDRFIKIWTPSKSTTSQKYPVVYLLDGDVLFENTQKILLRLSKEPGLSDAANKIIVAIGNIWERDRDYTPTHIQSSPGLDSMSAAKSGGGEKFTSFLEKELIPFVESNYPASSKDRIFIGHSFGGLLVMNTLLHHLSLFQHYVAIDPSMWWDDSKLLKDAQSILANKTFNGTSLFIAVANTRDKSYGPEELKRDKSEKTALIRPSLL